MTGHVAELVKGAELREAGEARFRELLAELDHVEDFDPYMYVPPGPVAQAFLNSTALTAIIMGPLGGGKTTACMFKRLKLASRAPLAWHPVTRKPTRMCRAIVLRDTFRQTEKTVLASWQKAFPKGYRGSTSVGGNDRPYTHTLNFFGGDGVRIEAITEFAGLGEQAIGEMLKGTEYSIGWLNEVDTHAEGALDDLEGRLGRYPSEDMLLTPREIAELEEQLGHRVYAPEDRMRALIGDMNAPTLDNWTYETLVTNRGPDREFFQQPSGMSPEAENIFALPGGRDYYERMVKNFDERYIRRMVHNMFGYSLAGKAVHASFDRQRHVALTEIAPNPALELHIGVDVSTGGLSPAAMFAQASTRIRFIDELYEGHGVGPARFAEALQRLMNERYPNFPRSLVRLWPDPASQFGADKEAGQLNALEILASVLGVPARVPGDGSNEIGMRLAVVDKELMGFMEPDTSLLVSPRCKLYIAGIEGKYRYKRKPATATNEFEDLPEKAHPWSDLQDAGQYAIIGVRGPAYVRDLMAQFRKAVAAEAQQQQTWSSQRNAAAAVRANGGFDPHKAGL